MLCCVPPFRVESSSERLARENTWGNKEEKEAWPIVEFLKFIAASVRVATKHEALQSLKKREREVVAGWGEEERKGKKKKKL